MKAGLLRAKIAEATLTDERSVKVAMRHLREAGLLTAGAHGVNAPNMTFLDAARVLIAMLYNDAPGRNAVTAVNHFGSLPWANPDFAWSDNAFTLESFDAGGEPKNFEQAVAGLISIFTNNREDRKFKEACNYRRDGTIELPACSITLAHREETADLKMLDAVYAFHDLQPITLVGEKPKASLALGGFTYRVFEAGIFAYIAEAFEASTITPP